MKNFNISEYKDSYAFKCILDEIITHKFENIKSEQRLRLLQNFDKCVSYVSDMPYANIVSNGNYDNDSLNDVCIRNIKHYNSGIEMLFDYFVGKRQQYQKNCVKNNNKGVYTFAEFETLKKCYNKSPITKSRVYLPYETSDYSSYLMNPNVSDSYMYAGVQTSEILASMVDGKKLLENAKTIEEKAFVQEGLLDQGNLIRQEVNKILSLYDNKRLCDKVDARRKKIEKQIQCEWQLIKDLEELFEGETRKKALFICCFSDKIWPLLDDESKIKAINLLNARLAKNFEISLKEIDYSYFKMIDTDKERIGVGDVTNSNGVEILKSMLFSYSLARGDFLVENCLSRSDYENEITTNSYLESRECLKNEQYDLVRKRKFDQLLVKFSKDIYSRMISSASELYKGNIEDICLNPKALSKEMMNFFGKKSWRKR